jgi:hypothetical protein
MYKQAPRQVARPTNWHLVEPADWQMVQPTDRSDHRGVGARPDRRTGPAIRGYGSVIRPARNHLSASLPTACGRVSRRFSRPVTRTIANAHLHGHSGRYSHSDRRAREACDTGWHIRANDCYVSGRDAFCEGAQATLKSYAGAPWPALHQPCLLWPPPNTRCSESNPDGRGHRGSEPADYGSHTNRYSDASRCGYAEGSDPGTHADSDCHSVTYRRAVTNSHCVTDPYRDSCRGDFELDGLGNTDRGAVTNSSAVNDRRGDTDRHPITNRRDARRKGHHSSLKSDASAFRLSFNQSRFLRPPTRFATCRCYYSAGRQLAGGPGARFRRCEHDACSRIDRRRRDRPTHTRGSTKRIGDIACVRNGSGRIIVRADYSAFSLSARWSAIASNRTADGRRESRPRRYESVPERSGVGDVEPIQLVGDRDQIAS